MFPPSPTDHGLDPTGASVHRHTAATECRVGAGSRTLFTAAWESDRDDDGDSDTRTLPGTSWKTFSRASTRRKPVVDCTYPRIIGSVEATLLRGVRTPSDLRKQSSRVHIISRRFTLVRRERDGTGEPKAGPARGSTVGHQRKDGEPWNTAAFVQHRDAEA